MTDGRALQYRALQYSMIIEAFSSRVQCIYGKLNSIKIRPVHSAITVTLVL